MLEYLMYLAPYMFQYKYFAVFGALVIAGFGVPIPEEATLILSGYMVSQGLMDFTGTFAVCYAGVIGGDLVTYVLGRYGGRWVLGTRFSRWLVSRRRLSNAQYYYRRYGPRFLLFARQMPGVRFPAFFTAGMLKMPLSRFLLFDAFAGLISMPVVFLISVYFGQHLQKSISLVSKIGDFTTFILGILLGLVVISFFIYRTVRKRRESEEEE